MRRALHSAVLVLGLVFVFGGTAARAEPPTSHEIIDTRPSGFWTSNRPAVGGAYRYRLLGIGVAIALITGIGMWRMVRKANRDRAGGVAEQVRVKRAADAERARLLAIATLPEHQVHEVARIGSGES